MKVFAKSFWGYVPEIWPFVAFKDRSSRDIVLRNWQEGDIILNFQSKNEGEEETRGCLHGFSEFGTTLIDAKMMIEQSPYPQLKTSKHFDARGNYRWPYALRMLRAWRFTSRENLKVSEILGDDFYKRLNPRQLRGLDPYLLPKELVERIKLIPYEEVVLSQGYGISSPVISRGSPFVSRQGPRPTEGGFHLERKFGKEAYTYLLQYGDNPVWKVGCTSFLEKRVNAINRQIPHDLCDVEKWKLVLYQKWSHINYAYDMEQIVIESLRKMGHVVNYERTACSRIQIDQAWTQAYMHMQRSGIK